MSPQVASGWQRVGGTGWYWPAGLWPPWQRWSAADRMCAAALGCRRPPQQTAGKRSKLWEDWPDPPNGLLKTQNTWASRLPRMLPILAMQVVPTRLPKAQQSAEGWSQQVPPGSTALLLAAHWTRHQQLQSLKNCLDHGARTSTADVVHHQTIWERLEFCEVAQIWKKGFSYLHN